MIAFSLAEDKIFQSMVILTCLWATVMIWRGAFLGMRGHRPARIALGSISTYFVVVYSLQLFEIISIKESASILRGGSLILWGALGWTAYTGLSYWHKAQDDLRDAKKVRDETAG